MFCLMETLPDFENLKSEILNLKSSAEGVSKQLRGWADALQNSRITGQRYLNQKVRRTEKSRKDRQEFLDELAKIGQGQSKTEV